MLEEFDAVHGPLFVEAVGLVPPPLSDGTWTYTWQGGRNLAGMSKTGTTISYKYNKDGIRTSKTVNGVTTTYTLVGDKVTHETNGTNGVYYRYDSGDKLNSMSLNGVAYYYFRNAQGDIIGLFDNAGTVVVEYTYDAWGNILSTTGTLASTVGKINPYRYRGYRFDEETGLYYLQSRYYNPAWGRFVNEDTVIAEYNGVNARNLFSYCSNDPVNMADNTGLLEEQYAGIGGGGSYGSIGYAAGGSAIAALVFMLIDYIKQTPSIPLSQAQIKTLTISKPNVQAKTKSKPPEEDWIVYRYGGTNPGNFVPSPRDVNTNSGLSFSLNPPLPGISAAVSTIGALNATGLVTAINDRPGHVRVDPKFGTLAEWRAVGPNHPCTIAVRSVCIKWDGSK